MSLNSVKWSYCSYGNGIALSASGEEDDVIKALNILYNHQAHNDAETVFFSDRFGYVKTNKRQLERGLRRVFCTRETAEKRGGARADRRGCWERACQSAHSFVESIPHENFMDTARISRVFKFAPFSEESED